MRTVTLRTFLRALRKQETGGVSEQSSRKEGDGGKAYGPLQIWRAYWDDSHIKHPYESLYKWRISVACLICYMLRHLWYHMMRLEVPLDVCEKIARVHNGGPKAIHANRIGNTDRYWESVKLNIFDVEEKED